MSLKEKKNHGGWTSRSVWITTDFGGKELDAYAERLMVRETRTGLVVMSVLLGALLMLALGLYRTLGFSGAYIYNSMLLVALAVHIGLCARRVGEIKALHLLGMTLLTISAAGLISTAHQTGELSPATLASVVLLFLVVPLVPWGLREAATVVAIIYGLLSASVWSVSSRFEPAMLWTLQYYMLSAAVVSLTLVALGVSVRKKNLAARYELEQAHQELLRLSSLDPLTGAGNRRMMDEAPARLRAAFPGSGHELHFVLLDLDGFKAVNDTHGHDVGDRALVALVNACKEAVGDSGVVLRLGGDEFVMMFVDDEPNAVVDRALDAFAGQPLRDAAEREVPLEASWGRASAPLHADCDIDALYQQADEGLYAAKARRKRGIVTAVGGSSVAAGVTT